MDANTFIARWAHSGGAERANYGQFLSELCRVIGVPEPEPTQPHESDNRYVFEKTVQDVGEGGKSTVRRIDLYRRGAFVLEAKQGVEKEVEQEQRSRQAKGKKRGHGLRGTQGWDAFMERARQQAESYVRLLPEGEGRPPFILVVDVGHVIELYAEFSRTGGVYRPYPNAREHRIRLEDLRQEDTRQLLRKVWLEPLTLDPSLVAAQVTREVADTLASISRSMEGKRDVEGKLFSPERVSAFLMRLIFTMFVEDIRMIPGEKFRKTLQGMKGNPQAFVPTVSELWEKMAKGGYSVALQEKIKHFNGGLFENVEVLEVDDVQLELITEASGYDWARVEPSIFGTLVERALNPRERHKLGAHYTPRAYVERLVEQTVITPLEQDWKGVQVEIQSLLSKADNDSKLERARQQAISTIQAFLADLRHTTVLDPAAVPETSFMWRWS